MTALIGDGGLGDCKLTGGGGEEWAEDFEEEAWCLCRAAIESLNQESIHTAKSVHTCCLKYKTWKLSDLIRAESEC